MTRTLVMHLLIIATLLSACKGTAASTPAVEVVGKQVSIDGRSYTDVSVAELQTNFVLSETEVKNLRGYLRGGGLLVADACSGRKAFDAAFRREMQKAFPDGKLEPQAWRLDEAVQRKFDLSQRESILVRAARTVAGGLRRGEGPGRPRIDLSALLAEADPEYRSFVVDGDPTVSNTHVDHFSADVALRPHGESARYKVQLMTAVLERIGDVARTHQVPLALLFIPHPTAVAADYDWPVIDRAEYPDYDPRNMTAPLASTARVLRLPFLDLFESYRSVDANALYFHGGDDHWNAAGQRLAAEHMARIVAPMLMAPR